MPRVLVTGMSGTGKSTALQILGQRGHRVVDTDTDQWSHWVSLPDGSPDWIWREEAIAWLLGEALGVDISNAAANYILYRSTGRHVEEVPTQIEDWVFSTRVLGTVESSLELLGNLEAPPEEPVVYEDEQPAFEWA